MSSLPRETSSERLMSPLEQLTSWANKGLNVTLHINDGHETELGKPSYCLFLSNDEGEWEDDNDIHDSFESAVEAIKSAPFTPWSDFKRVDPDTNDWSNFTCELPDDDWVDAARF